MSMMKIFLRAWWWLLGCLAFFTVFAFALNNRNLVTVHWFFGYESQIQLVLLVLLTVMIGVLLGALAVLPLWWRQYRMGRAQPITLAGSSTAAPAEALNPSAASSLGVAGAVDAV